MIYDFQNPRSSELYVHAAAIRSLLLLNNVLRGLIDEVNMLASIPRRVGDCTMHRRTPFGDHRVLRASLFR